MSSPEEELDEQMRRAAASCSDIEEAAAMYCLLFGSSRFYTSLFAPGEEAFADEIGTKFESHMPITVMRDVLERRRDT